MCGIGGVFGGAVPPGALEAMAEEMKHRGPDDSGVWAGPEGGMAFRRLAIIDLDPRSSQPMQLGDLHMVFNGEIYNYLELRTQLESIGHVFETAGDAEVLLHAWAEWGAGALDRLNGMFAFAIWDAGRMELTLASDPFGEKPLYWTEAGGLIYFCSDIRGLMRALPVIRTPSEEPLAAFVANGFMPEVDRSFFLGVNRLPAASLLRWRDGNATVRRYWAPGEVEVPRSYPQAVEELRSLLEDSVRLRLRSDVPVGTSLSGGVDSSSVLALAALLGGEATRHAFTASFPGSPKDEWGLAELAASRSGVTRHHRVLPSGTEAIRDLPALVRDQEEPFGSLSIYAQWRVYQAAKETGVTVLLDGQGGDELFGGYPGTEAWARRAEGFVPAVGWALGERSRVRDLALAYGSDSMPARAVAAFRARQASPYASREAKRASGLREYEERHASSPLRRELERQAFETSLPSLLRYADRDSMAHSREVRLPLLDRRIADFALSCPPSYLSDGGWSKRILRDAVRDLVPAAILESRDKIGFEPPQARWLGEPEARALIADVMLDPSATGSGLYDRARLEAEIAEGSWSDPSGIWRALNVELWRREFTGD